MKYHVIIRLCIMLVLSWLVAVPNTPVRADVPGSVDIHTAYQISCLQVQLGWNAVSGAWGYNIYVDGDYNDSTSNTSATILASIFTPPSMNIQVAAFNGDGEGDRGSGVPVYGEECFENSAAQSSQSGSIRPASVLSLGAYLPSIGQR